LTINSGGLLSTGTNAVAISGTAGATRLTAGNGSGGAYDLVVHQYNTGGLTISAVIGDNAGNATSLTKAGTQTLTLSGINTYTGNTYVNSGTLSLTGTLGATAISTFGSGIFNESSTGVISGAASFVQGSSATSVLSGTNT